MGVHARRVLAPLGVLDDLVVDRGGEQAERGDRRAQVVRDGGEELAPHALLALEPDDHRVDVAPDARDLVVPRSPVRTSRRPSPTALSVDADAVEVGERERCPAGARSRARARPRRRRAGSSSPRRGWRRTSGPRTAPTATASDDRAEQRDRPELAPQPAGPARRDRLAREHGERSPSGRDDRERHQRPVRVVADQHDAADTASASASAKLRERSGIRRSIPSRSSAASPGRPRAWPAAAGCARSPSRCPCRTRTARRAPSAGRA